MSNKQKEKHDRSRWEGVLFPTVTGVSGVVTDRHFLRVVRRDQIQIHNQPINQCLEPILFYVGLYTLFLFHT